MKILGSFYAFEQKFGVSRYYKIYVSKDGIHAAWIADRDCELSIARMQATGYTGATGIVAGVAQKARQLEAQYDQDIPAEASWLSRHKQNFSLKREDVRRMVLSPNPRPQVRPNCYAILNLESSAGARSFYLVGQQDRAQVGALLENVAPVEGNAALAFEPQPSALAPSSAAPGERAKQANTYSWIGAIILGLACCAFFYARSHSPFALIGLLISYKFHGMLYNLYLMFNVNRDTAERLEMNRRRSQA